MEVIQSHSQTVIQSYGDTVTLSHSHTVTRSNRLLTAKSMSNLNSEMKPSDLQILDRPLEPIAPAIDSSIDQGWLSVLAKKVFRPSMIQAGAVFTDQGFCSIANFLTGVLVARACTKSEYGVFVLGLTILRFMTGLQNSLVSIPYTIQYPRCKVNNRSAYLGSTLVHQLVICILTAIGFFVASRVFAWRGAEDAMVSTMFMLSVASAAFMMREFIRLVMLAELRVWLNLAMSLFANSLTITAMLIAYRTKTLDSPNAYLIIAVCSGVPALIITGIYWQKMTLVSRRITADFKDNFQLGKWLVARNFAYIGAVSVYPIALASFHGTAAVAVYGACFAL